MISLLRTYLHLPKTSRGLAWEALRDLLSVELMVRFKHFKRYAPLLGKQGLESPLRSASPEQAHTIKEIRWAVRAVSRRFPWTCRCLVQAIAGKRMLQRRSMASTLYLGVDHGETSWLDAHAWLRCGEVIVTGGTAHERFRVISTFAEDTQ